MKQLLTFILALLFVTTAFGQRRIAVMVDTNAALINPTNFFVANSNSINNVVVGGGGGGTTYTNLTEGAGSATTFGGPVTVQGTLSVNNETFTDSGADDLRLDSGFNPGTDSAFDLGTPSLYWRTGYLDSVLSPAFVGGGNGLTNLDGTKILGVLTNNTTGNATTATTAGNITAGTVLNAVGGTAITNLNASQLTNGTVPLARLSGITTNELAGYIGTNELSAAAHAIYTGGSDNLGDHTATQDLNMGTKAITNAGAILAGAITNAAGDNVLFGPTAYDGSGLTNLNTGSPMDQHFGVLEPPSFDGLKTYTHPQLVVTSNNFGGYRYWMTYSRFPKADEEWTHVAASHDLVNWVDPTTNTTAERFVQADLNGVDMSGGWAADPNLFLSTNGYMVCLTMAYKYNATNGITNKLVSSSTADGVAWSDWVVLEEGDVGAEVPMECPTIVGSNGVLRLYYVNEQDYPSNALCYRTMVDGSGTNWNAAENVCNLTTIGSDANYPWGFDVKYSQYDKTWHLLYVGNLGGTPEYAKSDDGITWYGVTDKAIPTRLWEEYDNVPGGVYKPTMWPTYSGKWNIIFGTHGNIVTTNIPSLAPWQLVMAKDIDMPRQPEFEMFLHPGDGREGSGAAMTLDTMYSVFATKTTVYGKLCNGTETVRYTIPLAMFPDHIRDGSMKFTIDTHVVMTNTFNFPAKFSWYTQAEDGTETAVATRSVNEDVGSGAGLQNDWADSITPATVTAKQGWLWLGLGTHKTPTNTCYITGWRLRAW